MTQGYYNEGADTYLVYAAEDFEIAVWWFQVRQRQADHHCIQKLHQDEPKASPIL